MCRLRSAHQLPHLRYGFAAPSAQRGIRYAHAWPHLRCVMAAPSVHRGYAFGTAWHSLRSRIATPSVCHGHAYGVSWCSLRSHLAMPSACHCYTFGVAWPGLRPCFSSPSVCLWQPQAADSKPGISVPAMPCKKARHTPPAPCALRDTGVSNLNIMLHYVHCLHACASALPCRCT